MFQNIILLSKDYNIIKKNDPPWLRQRASGIPNTKNILSHHFHDRVSGYASHSNAQTRVQWLATPLSQPYPLQLASRVDQVRNSAYMGLNCQPHGQQSNAYTHQTKVVVIILPEMCVYIPQNTWKHQRNRNLKIQKIWLFQVLNRGSPGCPCHLRH